MTMNLSQLYELRNYWKGNPYKVVTKEVALAVLDSHISLLSGQNESSIIQSSTEPVQVTHRATTLDHMAHRQIAQQVIPHHQNGLLAAKRTS